jgi:hydroxymethylpyrimidine/phosphomethylpyrimidine kinase
VALSIAGSDPSGGAGLQADLKTFHRLGVYGEAVVTLITVQNTLGVTRVDVMAPDLILEQIHAVYSDICPQPPRLVRSEIELWWRPCAAAEVHISAGDRPVMINKHGAADREDAQSALRMPGPRRSTDSESGGSHCAGRIPGERRRVHASC